MWYILIESESAYCEIIGPFDSLQAATEYKLFSTFKAIAYFSKELLPQMSEGYIKTYLPRA